jgi:multidrug resistance efflux pump
MTRLAFLTFAFTLLVGAGVWLDQESRPEIHTTPARQKIDTIFACGRIEGATPDVELRFERSGRITEVCVQEGDFVEAGTVLLRLDNAAARQQVALKQAELHLAQAELLRLQNGAHEQERAEAKSLWQAREADWNRAKLNWERSVTFREKKVVTKEELEQDQGELDRLTAEVQAARARYERLNAPAREDEQQAAAARCESALAQLELAQTELAKTELTAPSAGQVAWIGHEAGELTGPTVNEPAITLVDTRRLRVRAFIEELDVPKIKLAQTAQVFVDGWQSAKLEAHITQLAPRMSRKQAWSDRPDERSDLKTREVLLDLETNAALLPGLSVEVEIRIADPVQK